MDVDLPPLASLVPSKLPRGYSYYRSLSGEGVGAFSGSQPEVNLHFTRGTRRLDSIFPLVVAWSPVSDAQLVGTEGRPGVEVVLGSGSFLSFYHEGMWVPGDGPDSVEVVEGIRLHWDRSVAHSITVPMRNATLAVRGVGNWGIDQDALISCLESMPLLRV